MDKHQVKTYQAIAQINQQLRQENVGLKIYLRGQRLYLRGSLPPKAHSSRNKPHQQDLALGYRANPAGLTAAYKQAKLIEAQVINREFDWQKYQKRNLSKAAPKTFQDWILKFKEDFYAYSQSKDKEKRWKPMYATLCKLPLEEDFTLADLEKESLKLIEACSGEGSKKTTLKHFQQFTTFLNREGVL